MEMQHSGLRHAGEHRAGCPSAVPGKDDPGVVTRTKAPETLNRACLQAQQLGLTKGRRSTTSFHLLLPSLLRVAVYPTGGRGHRPSVGNHVLRFATDLSDYTA